jgi:hypothetical protein
VVIMSEENKSPSPTPPRPSKYQPKPGFRPGYDPLQPQRRLGHHPEDKGQTPTKRDDDVPFGWPH